ERTKAPFASLGDLVRRTALRQDELETLAHAGAMAGFGLGRRRALWQIAEADLRPDSLLRRREARPSEPSPLDEMPTVEETLADYADTGLTTGPHLVAHMREELRRRGVVSAAELRGTKNGSRVKIAGHVIVRQRPGTAKGLLFLTLEDETG